ncbi:MAG: hypothetical protein QM564_06845 [Bergeyella sp.]
MNKQKRRILVQYFLRTLRKKMETEDPEQVSSVFLQLFNREELIQIIQWLFMDKVPEELGIDTMNKEELLQTIGDDVHILSYCLEQWSKEIQKKITPQKVYDILDQLQLHTHYLMEKVIADWDEYDYGNFNALSYKAGAPQPMYGIFCSDVSEEDKYIITTPPARLYDTFEKAEAELNRLIVERKFQKSELKIMRL